jgi:hypothetical protein
MPTTSFCETIVSGVRRQTPKEYAGTASSNASGKVVFNMTEDGTASGNAIFSSVQLETLTYCDFVSNRIIKCINPVLSGDLKTLTMDVKQNGSLLSLGLIPFEQAATGIAINMRIQGV